MSSDASLSRPRQRRSRVSNGLVEPPFQLQPAEGEKQSASAFGQTSRSWTWCPCTRLSTYAGLPSHLADNEFVVRGYRVDWTPWHCFLSVFQLHNETLNVWSHLLGFLVFVGLVVSFCYNYGSEYSYKHKLLAMAHVASVRLHSLEHAGMERLHSLEHTLEHAVDASLPPSAPRWPLFTFLFGACACLFLSAMCHTFGCVSARVNAWIWKLDYVGIALLIACSFFPPVFYSFLCNEWARHIYLAAITAGCACTLTVSLAPRFGGPSWRSVRASIFSALGCSGIVPILHQVVYYCISPHRMPAPLYKALLLELLMGGLYLSGAWLYARRVPERLYPGVFDYALSSHNLFHLLVVAAALVHVEASLVLLAWRDHHACE